MTVLTAKRNSVPTVTTPLFEQTPVFSPSGMYTPTTMYTPSSLYSPSTMFPTNQSINPSTLPTQRMVGYNTPVWGWETGSNVPPANIVESIKEFTIELVIPGWQKEEICIELDHSTLVVRSESQVSVNVMGSYRHREFTTNTFCRMFQLPENVTVEKIKATYENGILYITVPKTGTVSSLRIN